MKLPHFILAIFLGVCSIMFNSCRKNESNTEDCFPGAVTYRQIINKPAAIRKLTNGLFYIVEQGTIDTRLHPCNLPVEFQVDNLQVIISGDVKTTVHTANEPCCTENFVISNITK